MAIKKALLGGAIVAALAGAGLVGALVSTTSVGFAEEADDVPAGPPGPRGGGPGNGFMAPAFLDVAAEALGISQDELRSDLESGDSITSVAQAQGVDVQVVVDALVEDATTRIQDQVDSGDLDADEGADRIAELPDRIAEVVAHEGVPAPGPGVPGHGPGFPGSFDVAAQALGITEVELRTELESGESITSVAQAQDVDIQSVIDALVADATAQIQERVDAGDVAADEAAAHIAELPDHMADFVSRAGLPEHGDC